MTTAEVIQLVGVCGTVLTGLGGISIALLTIYLNHKGRSSHYRQAVYGKQIDGFVEISLKLHDWFTLAIGEIVRTPVPRTDKDKLSVREACFAAAMELDQAVQKWTLFLPTEVFKPILHFQIVFDALTATSQVAHNYHPKFVQSQNPGMDLGDAYAEVVKAMRKNLGTEPLSKEALKIMGTDRDYPKDKTKA